MNPKKLPDHVPASALIDGIDPRSLMMHAHHWDRMKTTRYRLTPDVVGTLRTVLSYLAAEYEATAGSLRLVPDSGDTLTSQIIRSAEQSAQTLRTAAGRLGDTFHVFTLASAENRLVRWLESSLRGEAKRRQKRNDAKKDGE